jgi:phosphocarrier protein HPr
VSAAPAVGRGARAAPGISQTHGRGRRTLPRGLPAQRPIEPPMIQEPHVARRQVAITNTYGLHLRPADKFVRLAHKYQSEIRVYFKGHPYNGKSILDLTTLAAECGTQLELEARGPDAEEAVAALADLILARFHETEEGQYKDPAP